MMKLLEELREVLIDWLPPTAAAVGGLIVLFVLRVALARAERTTSEHHLRDQLVMLGATLVALLIVILNLPIKDSSRTDLLNLLGVVLSAAIALSSTTFLSNAMGALMLRAVKNFRLGDFVSVGDHFGRVTERGLFHTELQTEERDLVTLPNMYLITNPVRVVRPSGTIVSCEVSLGYDVSRRRIEPLLVEGATQAGLQEPFVQVMQLGDFSVTYRVAGLLGEARQLITARSNLRKAVMDALHGGGVEIVSPTFMNTRAFDPDRHFKPTRVLGSPDLEDPATLPEELIFDKANEAEIVTQGRKRLGELDERIKELTARVAAGGEGKDAAKKHLRRLERRRALLDEEIKERAAGLDQADD